MKDFTLAAYQLYLEALKKNDYKFLLFRDFMGKSVTGKICLIRHDIDRKPGNALKMAQLEKSMGIKATYYFRCKSNVFKPQIISAIEKMGHEIGYHYESLSDTNGNYNLALEDFAKHLDEFRKIARIDTISMHGRPLKPYDNRDLWKHQNNHSLLKSRFGLLGEVYLDIDYTDIAYINDTGRNWTSGEANRRDKVDSKIEADFKDRDALLAYLKGTPHHKVVFQIHPERWAADNLEWLIQYNKDFAINMAKRILS